MNTLHAYSIYLSYHNMYGIKMTYHIHAAKSSQRLMLCWAPPFAMLLPLVIFTFEHVIYWPNGLIYVFICSAYGPEQPDIPLGRFDFNTCFPDTRTSLFSRCIDISAKEGTIFYPGWVLMMQEIFIRWMTRGASRSPTAPATSALLLWAYFSFWRAIGNAKSMPLVYTSHNIDGLY